MNLNTTREFPIIIGWNEVERDIIQKVINPFYSSKKGGFNQHLDRLTTKKIMIDTCERMRSSIYKRSGRDGVITTLKYMYHIIRVGIIVCIRDGKLKAFIPFANPDYKNNWSKQIRFEIKEKRFDKQKNKFVFKKKTTDNLDEYMKYKKSQLYSIRDVNHNIAEWAANAYFVNNAIRDDVWGQHSLPEFYSMISETVKHREVHDCIFFLNKRDYPLLRHDLKEPYFFLWSRGAPQINKSLIEFNGYMAPVVSPYTNEMYLDLPFPIAQDWIMAIAPDQYFNSTKAKQPWHQKQPTAFFRGSLTGRVDFDLNQRLIAAKLSNEWKNTKTILFDGKRVPILDAGITSWNLSDKINKKGLITFTNPKETKIKLANRVPMDESVNRYKYILNIDGHARPNRTGYLLASGSLMLMVESAYVIGKVTWIDRLLQDGVHYISIAADLSDLELKLKWCRNHDDECQKIVANAQALASRIINKDTIMDYVSCSLNAISNRSTLCS